MEGHLIGASKGETLLNRRGEWEQNLPPKLTIEGEEGSEECKGKRKPKDESNKIKPHTETEADALPDAQRQDKMTPVTNTRKRRKVGEGDRDKGTPVTQTNRVKGLSIKEMLQKMHMKGKRNSRCR